jgi:hypothetical protein
MRHIKAVLFRALVLATVFFINHSHAQSGYAVTERGADYQVLQKNTVEHGTNRIHRYTELASGMHHKDANGQWMESKKLIESFPQGAK